MSSPAPKQKKRLTVPREDIPWYPTISPDLCNGCGECRELCRPGVFQPGLVEGVGRPKMRVANPYSCVVLCTRCVAQCPSGAISLPSAEDFRHFVEIIK
ncbi:MAG: ferredoxin family protein [Chlorobium sp.]|nr:ferredoxin family protein [Chlorobium phaeovibrioides]NQU45919.1 ferredoxin family protein [Chlorobium sp.]